MLMSESEIIQQTVLSEPVAVPVTTAEQRRQMREAEMDQA